MTVGEGEKPELSRLGFMVKFAVGSGKKPELSRLVLMVVLAVGRGRRPDLGSVEFAVKLTVGKGEKPRVGVIVKFKTGAGRPETDVAGIAEALTVGKLPADTVFNVGKAWAENEESAMPWLATGKGKSKTVTVSVSVSVVVPLATVVVSRYS